MTASEIIDQVLSYTDNIPPTDADYANRRIRLLNYLREILAKVWYAKEWPFARRVATLPVLANEGFVNVPDDYLGLGDYGGVLLADQNSGDPLDHVPEHIIVQQRQTGSTTQTPAIFSVFGQDPITLVKRLQFPMNAGDYNVLVNYLKDVPDITDGPPDNNGVDEIPVQYHQTVLVTGLQSRTLQSKGDASWNSLMGTHEAALLDMRRKERRRQGTIWQMPSFFGGRRHGRYA